MERLNIIIFNLFLSTSFLFGLAVDNVERKAYIVYMGNALGSKSLAVEHHQNLLLEVTQDEEVAQHSIIQSYGKSFNAFAAYLLPDEAQRLKENENVISVFPSTTRELQTTRSWDFMSMPLTVERNSQNEGNIIIGLLDSGIDIDSPSFNDQGFGPPPSKWKGVCDVGANFSGCNNKVIGARYYNLLNLTVGIDPSVADTFGHGTHTASIAAGVAVNDASLYDLGKGIARGGVPSARIAIYKACHRGCQDVDILAALDDAIDDGVDILSLSLASIKSTVTPFFEDSIAIGSFHAMKRGILTCAAAGNNGPELQSLSNGAPWVLSVGASFTDRRFMTPLIIGDRTDIMGISMNTFNPTDMVPLITQSSTKEGIEGKIAVLNREAGPMTALGFKNLSAVGMISLCFSDDDFASSYVLPAACVPPSIANDIETYINSTNNAVGSIGKSIEMQNTLAPFMAPFSARGPDPNALPIIKPDIVAPGVDIVAAYTKYNTITPYDTERYSEYNVLSGTSMACPHVAGAAAYVKSFHPDWSTSAIKSALMTTAYEIPVKDENAEFAYGAGHIDPTKALQPGLVYEMEELDYVRFLCNLGYTGKDIEKIIGEGVDCSSIPKLGGEDDLNYPSMLLMQKNDTSNVSAVFNRSVKNVGDANSMYKANVTTTLGGVEIKVNPDTLTFKEVNEVISFTVEVKGPPLKELNDSLISASLVWTDCVHNVKSPIFIFPQYKLPEKKL